MPQRSRQARHRAAIAHGASSSALSTRCRMGCAASAAESAMARPGWSKAVKLAALEAASSSTRGSGWAASGLACSWECRAAQSRQARPEEAQEPSWGTATGATLSMLHGCARSCPCGARWHRRRRPWPRAT
eukprot:scaffold81004_cov59-Phaeocystis_antarctica.AAC.1